MRIVYFDCMSGISGDMTLGALVDAGVEVDTLQAGIESLGLKHCQLRSEGVKRRGFRATKVHVDHQPEHAHRHLHHITDMIDSSRLSDVQKDLAKRIFTRLGEAEAHVHGTSLQKVHFHEVGAVDSIADIVGTAMALDLLGADRIACSPVPTGTGHVTIAHGRVAVPAPATAELLKGIPLAPSEISAELTTPTGAAIVATVVNEFGPLPPMTIERIGYGAGSRDFKEQANLLRMFVGETGDTLISDQIWILETNLDDISGEIVGHCSVQLAEAGALDVYSTPIQMKKNRPAIKLSVLCEAERVAHIEQILFRETTTIGVRRWPASRHKLDRRPLTVQTQWGPIEGKLAVLGDGSRRFSPEFESCKRVATEHKIPLGEVYEAARRAYFDETAEP
ncbi:MAG: nickel pincer cofactor biosynthesis protein LarC [Pirellulaceae bacterium]